MEEVTEEELNRLKNFDRLLDDFNHIKVEKKAVPSRWLKSTGLIAAISAIIIYTINKPTIPKPVEKFPVKSDSTLENKTVERSVLAPSPSLQKPITHRAHELDKQPKTSKEIEVTQDYVAAEPTFGYQHLYNYFDSELRYPEKYVNDSISGIVTATFLISKEGKADQLTIQNSLGDAFDEEVKRLIVGMPKWKPATLNRKPVTSKISIPFTFSITKRVK
jgi:TonB family protein